MRDPEGERVASRRNAAVRSDGFAGRLATRVFVPFVAYRA